ncbi:MAG TPA: SPOR domain-containing protein [Methylocystis sp.]|jgi:hypothetical protein
MRETSVRGPAIDLGEFERRLRGPERAPHVEDPLSELARLVHGEDPAAADPYSQILAEARDARAHAAELRGSYDAAPPVAAEPPYYPEPSMEQPLEPAYPVDPDYRDAPPGYSPQQAGYESAPYGAEAGWSDDSQYLDYGQSDEDYDDRHGWRSWFRPWHAVVAISLVAVLSIGFAFWHRSGSNASREIATIVAPEGPVKVKPSAETESTAPDASAAVVLDRREQAPVQKVVINQEQAVDPTVPPDAVKLGNAPVNLPHEPPPASMAGPKKVKTVTVRPDGSRVDNAALPPSVVMASRPAPEAKPSAAAGAVGATTATPSSAAKATATPPQMAKPKPAAPKVAAVGQSAETAAESDQATAPTKGGFAVQFGAADSEDDARELLKTVVSKYRSQLGGLKPTFKMATVNDKTVYRVRVGAVSKESANAICSKVKATGGSCFVAGN